MGNSSPSCRMALTTEKPAYVAGEAMRGSVVLFFGSESGRRELLLAGSAAGIVLRLEGAERVEVVVCAAAPGPRRGRGGGTWTEGHDGGLAGSPGCGGCRTTDTLRAGQASGRRQRRREIRRQRHEQQRRYPSEQRRRTHRFSDDWNAPVGDDLGRPLLVESVLRQHSGEPHRPSPSPAVSRVVERYAETLVREERAVASAAAAEPRAGGQLEYPFEWRLPPDLPSTMRCTVKGPAAFGTGPALESATCEIRYTLTARLGSLHDDSDEDDDDHDAATARRRSRYRPTASADVTILARPPDLRGGIGGIGGEGAAVAGAEEFPVVGGGCCCFCCFGCRPGGAIDVGYEIRPGAWTPQGEAAVAVALACRNRSDARVKRAVARWHETVAWRLPDDSLLAGRVPRESRTLATARIPVPRGDRSWQPAGRRRPSNRRPDRSSSSPLRGFLVRPYSAHDSYAGRLFSVRHSVSIGLEMRGMFVRAPTTASCRIQVARPCSGGPATVANDYYGRRRPRAAAEVIAEATLVPNDWEPTAGGVRAVPEARVVVLEREERADGRDVDETAGTGPAVATLQCPTAPDESLLLDAGPAGQPPTLDQLRLLVRTAPENLSVVLGGDDEGGENDAAWSALAESLTPGDFASLVRDALPPPRAPAVARCLARAARRRLRSRHVLACLYALPEAGEGAAPRMQVVEQMLPYVSDLHESRAMLEEEMSPSEAARFREILRLRPRGGLLT